MKKVINTLLDKLAEQAGEVATCKVALATAAEEVLDLEAKLAGVPAQYKSNEVSG